MALERLATGCGLPRRFLETIQHGTMNYSCKGVPTYKSPFDLALYQLLLWEQKPRTLIEIGSKWVAAPCGSLTFSRTTGSTTRSIQSTLSSSPTEKSPESSFTKVTDETYPRRYPRNS